jgi:hypothetical protein
MEDMLIDVFRKLFVPEMEGMSYSIGSCLMLEYRQLKITGLRALANFASIAEDVQLRDIWLLVLEGDGPFLKYTF